MVEYAYERSALEGGRFDIQNPDRVDGEGEQIYISKEVEAALPGKEFKLRCHHQETIFYFESELSSVEEALLAETVVKHQSNT